LRLVRGLIVSGLLALGLTLFRGAALAGDELIRQHLDQQQLARQRAVPERILLVAADAHALAQLRRAGEHRRFPAQAGLAQALAKVLVEVQQAGFVAQTLAVGRVADHQAFLVLVRARLEGRDFALVDLDPLAQAGALDVVAARLDQARVGFVAANPQRRLGQTGSGTLDGFFMQFFHSAGTWPSQAVKPHCSRRRFGAMSAAIIAASTRKVPTPHIGSASAPPSAAMRGQPERIRIAAARFSFSGAAPCCRR
jgi:hypothetical protein